MRPTRQRGFSLIELSVAILIALFLLAGLLTLVQGERKSNATQSALSALQDNQRIAMTLMTNVVQKAGYFPNPVSQTLSSFTSETLTAGTPTLSSGQVLSGLYSASAPGDTFIVRYYAPATDTNGAVINCAGQSNTTASTSVWYTNVFKVGVVNGTSWLQCQARNSGADTVLINLIPNVTNLSVLYGVAASAGGDDYSVVQYLNANQMSATNWFNVTAVKVTLTFQVPQWGTTGGQMMPSSAPNSTETFQRVIPIMSRTGVEL